MQLQAGTHVQARAHTRMQHAATGTSGRKGAKERYGGQGRDLREAHAAAAAAALTAPGAEAMVPSPPSAPGPSPLLLGLSYDTYLCFYPKLFARRSPAASIVVLNQLLFLDCFRCCAGQQKVVCFKFGRLWVHDHQEWRGRDACHGSDVRQQSPPDSRVVMYVLGQTVRQQSPPDTRVVMYVLVRSTTQTSDKLQPHAWRVVRSSTVICQPGTVACDASSYFVVFHSPSQQHGFNFPFQIGSFDSMSDSPSASQKFSVPVEVGDVIVLGTDGLWDNCFDEEITAVIK
eukprot:1140850-Pelagomonas_calceolata.AAC.3